VPRYDYTTVGHVTADVLEDGSRRPGGGAFYSALQAARLGRRALIITQGVAAEIEHLLAPYRRELEVEIHPAEHTTTLHTIAHGDARTQRVLAWAGPIEHAVAVDTAILHLAPVARETGASWRGSAGFVGLTPQGLVRTWARPGAEITQRSLAPQQMPRRCDAIVISEAERESCAWLIAAADGDGEQTAADARPSGSETHGVLVAITAGADPTTLHIPGGEVLVLEVPRIEQFVDDIGAGDVFAAAFFVSLREGRHPAEAAAYGNAAAAVRIGAAGPAAVGGRSAIEARLRALA
jgi:sugar/nucleoside kinase (ribokinase family)